MTKIPEQFTGPVYVDWEIIHRPAPKPPPPKPEAIEPVIIHETVMQRPEPPQGKREDPPPNVVVHSQILRPKKKPAPVQGIGSMQPPPIVPRKR